MKEADEVFSGLVNICANTLDARSKIEYFDLRLTTEKKEALRPFTLLPKIRFAFWNIAVLEIYKLYNQKEHFSAYHLIDLIMLHFDDLPRHNTIKKETLIKFRSELDNRQPLVRKIKHIRDKYIAHSDSNPDAEIKIKIVDIQDLTDLIKTILEKIGLSFFNTHLLWDIVESDHDIALVESLIKFQELRMLIIKKQALSIPQIETSELLKIINGVST